MLGKKRKLGKKIQHLKAGDAFTSSFTIEDKELLMYLGLTDDANPLYIQHDYASETPYQRPIVPTFMIFGKVSSIISMHLPGPGSHIIKQELSFDKPVYHYSEVKVTAEITLIHKKDHIVEMQVHGYDEEGDSIVEGRLWVRPPYEPQSLNASSLENFY
ncbi:MaoC/PaaZ C-terminal domain-containing protein [Halobacillus massiliensis]|uniref:MaoC/PaaZ C-terminal domain-containing protein n=1 Tax=Halobacillus massiliensis TaxID=1926286 RepID=UPI0015C49EEF|nr:MaoC/PaaZ C-terminal domain-containing protein [Halobacillus massiliensis]